MRIPAGISSCFTRATFLRKVSRRSITAEKLDSALEAGRGGKSREFLQVTKMGDPTEEFHRRRKWRENV